MEDVNLTGLFLTLVCNILSIIGCAWLLWRVQRMQPVTRRRLFPRQLKTLAMADLVFHFAASFVAIIGWCDIRGHNGFEAFVGRWSRAGLCLYGEHLLRFGTNASMLAELHLALGFFVQSKGSPPLARILAPSLRLVWPLALALTLGEALLSSVVQDAYGWCGPSHGTDWFYIVMLLISFVCCFASYISSMCMARSGGESVARRSWQRAAVYPVNFIITQMPMLVLHISRYHQPGYLPNPTKDTLAFIATLCQDLNGFANVVTYALQSRYAVKLVREHHARLSQESDGQPFNDAKEHFVSYNVRFGGVCVSELLPSYMSALFSTESKIQSSEGIASAVDHPVLSRLTS